MLYVFFTRERPGKTSNMSREKFKPKFADSIEQLFYEQLVWKFQHEFCTAADTLNVPDAELERAVEEMESKGSLGAAFAHFCRKTLRQREFHRRVADLEEETANDLLLQSGGGALYRDDAGYLAVRRNRG